MKSRLRVLVLLAVSGVALADGKPSQYDQSITNQMALDPDESLINDDGRTEDPHAMMSPTARAFRNGIINGRRMQQETHDVPPLPPIESQPEPHYVAPQAPPRPSRPPQQPHQPTIVAQAGGSYAAVGDDGDVTASVGHFPRDRGAVTNIYVQPAQQYQPPQYQQYQAPRQYQQYQPYRYAQEEEPVYEEPQAVYAPPPGPPQSTYVIIPGVPPTLATGYWPRGYFPRYAPVPRGYVYYHNSYRRGW